MWLTRIFPFFLFFFSFFPPRLVRCEAEVVYPWITVRGTSFGWKDPNDNGLGAFGHRTDGFSTRGVSVPFAIYKNYYGPKWLSHRNTRSQKCCAAVDIKTANGGIVRYRLVDRGPAAWTGNGIDLTHGAAVECGFVSLNQRDFKRPVSYRFIKNPKFKGEEIEPSGGKLVMPGSADDFKRREAYKRLGISESSGAQPRPISPTITSPPRRIEPPESLRRVILARSRARLNRLKDRLRIIRARRLRSQGRQIAPPAEPLREGNTRPLDGLDRPRTISESPNSEQTRPSSLRRPSEPLPESPILQHPVEEFPSGASPDHNTIDPLVDHQESHRQALGDYLNELKHQSETTENHQPQNEEVPAGEPVPSEEFPAQPEDVELHSNPRPSEDSVEAILNDASDLVEQFHQQVEDWENKKNNQIDRQEETENDRESLERNEE